MYPKLYINSTNLLTQKQQQEIAELTTFCRHHDGIDLSYPSKEEDLTHFLAYLPDGHLAACLALIPAPSPIRTIGSRAVLPGFLKKRSPGIRIPTCCLPSQKIVRIP